MCIRDSVKATGDASFGGNLYIDGTTTLYSCLYVSGDVSFHYIPELASALTPTSDYQLATKKYVDDNSSKTTVGTSNNPSLSTGEMYWNTNLQVLYVGN